MSAVRNDSDGQIVPPFLRNYWLRSNTTLSLNLTSHFPPPSLPSTLGRHDICSAFCSTLTFASASATASFILLLPRTPRSNHTFLTPWQPVSLTILIEDNHSVHYKQSAFTKHQIYGTCCTRSFYTLFQESSSALSKSLTSNIGWLFVFAGWARRVAAFVNYNCSCNRAVRHRKLLPRVIDWTLTRLCITSRSP